MKVQLRHFCRMPGCVGDPGDVLEVEDKLGLSWINAGGAVLTDLPLTTPPSTHVKKDVKTDDTKKRVAKKPPVKE